MFYKPSFIKVLKLYKYFMC